MKEFIIFNNDMIKQGEEESVIIACKEAKKIDGFVGVVQVIDHKENYGKIKEVIQGKTLDYMANK